MKVYGYIRVSTQSQADDGLSLDAQERQLQGYAMMHGLEIDKIFVERAVSGWKPLQDRPQGKRLTDVLSASDVILCPKLDRMFRSARDALNVAETLRKRDVSLHLLDLGGDVTGNGISKVFFTIVAAFAEFERDRIAERISDVKRAEKEKGRFLGGSRPFGYVIRDDGYLMPNAVEQETIKRVLVLRSEGHSLRAIANQVSSPTSMLSHMAIKRILRDHVA